MSEKEFLKGVANNIRNARIKAGKSQAEVLQETGINIARIEKYAPSIHLHTYYKICEYLGIEVNIVFL